MFKWKRAMALAAVGMIALGMAACGGGDDDTDPTTAPETATEAVSPTEGATEAETAPEEESPTEAASPDDGGEAVYPITIEHRFGQTVIESEPQRVASIGYNEHDTILALGVKPVLVRDWWNDQPFATWPWAQDALGDAEPVVMPSTETDIELIASVEPDLIIGIYLGMTQEEYDRLSQIAPVIAPPEGYIDYGVPWEVQTMLIAQSLGKEALGEELLAGVEEQFATIREEHPDWAGLTAVMGSGFEGDFGIYTSDDPRGRYLENLGFVGSPEIDEIGGDLFYAQFSPERAALIDVDVLFWLDSEEMMADVPLFQALDVVQEGRVIYLDVFAYGALSFSSVLSLPFMTEELEPQIDAAVQALAE